MKKLFASALALVLCQLLHSAPISIPSASTLDFANGTIRIRMTGESGIQYYARSTTDLTSGVWALAQSGAIVGSGTAADVDIPLPSPDAARAFFRIESQFEHRARLFISNYQRQLANGGPTTLQVNGTAVANTVTLTEDRANNQIVITGNGVPNYTPTIVGLDVTNGWNTPLTGGFQSLKLSENNLGASGGNNPNRIVVATETFRIPLNPVNNAVATDTSLGTVGVAINGLPIYNPFEDANQTAASGRIFSGCCGHPQLTGVYHYHKYPTCLRLLKGDVWQSEKEKCDEIDALIASGGHSPLIGFALDGWPIYGPVGWKDSTRESKLLKSSHTGANDAFGNPSYIAGSGDLDECNGLVSPTPEFPEGIYHYVMSLEADSDGSVQREISTTFGYDVRNTLKKHNLMPAGWETDATYVNALKTGFTLNGTAIPGTDAFTTFHQFIENLRSLLGANGMSAVAAEFETMKISYPFTIRKYRGTPSNTTGGGGGMTGNGGVTAISPASGTAGQSYFVTITLVALAGTPGLPPNNAPITAASVGGIALANPVRASNNTVTGTLTLPAGTAAGGKDVVVAFQGPNGQPAPTYTATGLFTVNAPAGTVYSDTPANYAAWTNGSTGGAGFGPWILTASGSAGHFLANTTAHTNMNVGTSMGFGLWANSGGISTATRNLTTSMGTGDSLALKFDNNWIDTSAQVSFALLDAGGNTRFRFYFTGGESNYRITDSNTGTDTALPYTESGLTLTFSLASATTYTFSAGNKTFTGTLAAGNAISRFSVQNANSGNATERNLYIGESTFIDAP